MLDDPASENNQNPVEDAIQQRLPGEQVLIVDSTETAEVYLSNLQGNLSEIIREAYPNAIGLYARIRYKDRIQEDKVFITLSAAN